MGIVLSNIFYVIEALTVHPDQGRRKVEIFGGGALKLFTTHLDTRRIGVRGHFILHKGVLRLF